MNIKHFLVMFVVMLTTNILFSQNTTIDITLENNSFTEASLQLAYDNATQSITSAKIENNHCVLKANITADDLYAIKFSENKFFLLCLHPKDNIKLTLDANNLQKVPAVTGSKSIAFTKELTDLLYGRQQLLDSLNRELQNNHTQRVLYGFLQEFTKFTKNHQETDDDIIEALNQNDSLLKLMQTYAPKGSVDKKNVDAFLPSAMTTLKVLRNYYSTFNNYTRDIAPAYNFSKMERLSGYDDFYLNLDAHTINLNDHDALIESLFGNYIEKASEVIDSYETQYYDGNLETPKAKVTFAKRSAAIINEYAENVAIHATDIKQDAVILKSTSVALNHQVQGRLEEIVSRYQKEFNDRDKQNGEKIRNLMLENKTDLSCLAFLDNFSSDKALQADIVNALYEVYPNHKLVIERYDKINSPANRTAEGSIAPELEFQDPTGMTRKLSDLRGKVVLIDFWASWCGPCRRENPHVVSMYSKYHDKGFEVFSVSLDNKAENWKAAIEKDGLVWPNHVSDLKGWGSAAAKLYGVTSIPSTFLLDREGRIIAKGLRGETLTQALKQIFGE